MSVSARAAFKALLLQNDAYLERIKNLEAASRLLAQAVHDYRLAHDTNGNGALETGRAWDMMRRAEHGMVAALEGGK